MEILSFVKLISRISLFFCISMIFTTSTKNFDKSAINSNYKYCFEICQINNSACSLELLTSNALNENCFNLKSSQDSSNKDYLLFIQNPITSIVTKTATFNNLASAQTLIKNFQTFYNLRLKKPYKVIVFSNR